MTPRTFLVSSRNSAYQVLESLKSAGIELIDSEPRAGIRDSRVAFVHPRSTGGVLTEIVEPRESH